MPSATPIPGLSGRAGIAAGCALAVAGAGAAVNALGATLSVPDWPLSYGRVLLTSWPGNTRYEQIHRLMAAALGLALVVLRLSLRGAAGRPRRLATIALGLFSAQVGIGGIVVLKLAPPLLSALHVVAAQALAALLAVLAFENARVGERPISPPSRGVRLTPWLTAMLTLQIVLGALSRHPPGQAAFIAALLAHLAGGLALVVLAPWVGLSWFRSAQPRTLRIVALVLMAAFVAQLAVAGALFVVSPEPFESEWPPPAGFPALHVAHVVLAAVLLACAAVLVAARAPRPEP